MNPTTTLRTVTATRYVTPLREGGSLPAVVEGDDDGLYVLKFRGAGQGCKALIAELVAGEIARALGLAVPEIVFMELHEDLARTESDPEIQDLIRASIGLNLALDFLPGALAYDPLVWQPVSGARPPEGADSPLGGQRAQRAWGSDSTLASHIVWFDAFVMNVDRTPRNTNLLYWHRQLWLIDHGAALTFQHQWDGALARSATPFALIKQHVLLPFAGELEAADAASSALLSGDVIAHIVELIPDEWMQDRDAFADPATEREAYRSFLQARLAAPHAFVEEAQRARSLLV